MIYAHKIDTIHLVVRLAIDDREAFWAASRFFFARHFDGPRNGSREEHMATPGIQPVLQALVLADQLYRDAETGKCIIAGTFNRLGSTRFPIRFDRRTYAYISLTDFEGTIDLTIRYVDLKHGTARQPMVLMQTTVSAESDHRLSTSELFVDIPRFPMPHPGAYAFDLLWNDELLGSVRILVEQLPEEAE